MKDAKAALKRAETLSAPSTTKKSAPKNRRVITRYMGSGIELFRYFIINEKLECKEKDLFSGLLKKLKPGFRIF